MRVDITLSLANNDDACKEGNLRSTISYSNDSIGGSKDNTHGTNHGTRMDMSVPLWLQRNRKSQEDLFCKSVPFPSASLSPFVFIQVLP